MPGKTKRACADGESAQALLPVLCIGDVGDAKVNVFEILKGALPSVNGHAPFFRGRSLYL
jgi:hypothetical protein